LIRNTKTFRNLQVSRPNRQTSVTDSDPLVDNAYKRSLQELIPAIRQKSQNAVTVDRINVKYYQEITTGRLCSCYKKEYDSPEASCLICYGVGRVGGFNVFGTSFDIVDTTYPNLIMLNIRIEDTVWPWKFELIDGQIEGYVEATVDVPSMRDVDALRLFYTGNYIKSYVRKFSDTSWHTLNRGSLLSLSAAEQRLVIRINLSRKTVEDVSPFFTHLYLRYKLVDRDLYVDMPRFGAMRQADNFNLTGLEVTQVFIPATLPNVRVGDVFRDLRNNTLWRVTEVTYNEPLGIRTSWDVNVRAVTSFEIYNQLP